MHRRKHRRVVVVAVAVLATTAGCGSQTDPDQAAKPPVSVGHPQHAKAVEAHENRSAGKVPPDRNGGAAGVCQPPPSRTTVIVSANPDTPDPRCVEVRPDQRLEVVNNSDGFGQPGRTLTVRWANFGSRSVPAGGSTTFQATFGSYLQAGDHLLRISLYSGSASEIYLLGKG